MNTYEIQTYNDLEVELEKAKDTLVVINDSIKRIVGRAPKLSRDSRSNDIKRCDNEKQFKNFQPDSASTKKRTNDSKSVFRRLSSPTPWHNDGESRPRLTSRVIRELPSRQEIVAAQCADSESRARNRRMFGSLLGTLHKFCQEESRLKQKEEKKAQIEKKLEEQEILERESIKKERETLFIDRKRKQMEIKRLELKMSRIKDFETWEKSMKYLKMFIKTNTFPSIYYRPKSLSKKTEKLLEDSAQNIEKTLFNRKEELMDNLIQLEENLHIPDYDNGEYDNRLEDNINCYNISNGADNSSVTHNTLSSSICVIKDKNVDPDSKENKIRNSGDPVLSSSVVIVNNSL